MLVVSGSVGLEPILMQAGLSAQANILAPFELRAWSQETAMRCLGSLARRYGLSLSDGVRADMCRRLRCCVPHHVQQFFDHLHLRAAGHNEATLEDVQFVYERDLLGVRGQIDLEHYESRLRMVLGDQGYRMALDLLTEAAVSDGTIRASAIRAYRDAGASSQAEDVIEIGDVLYTLEHDGYLERSGIGYRFVSGLLQDWWRARHGTYFTSIEERQ